MAIFRPVKCMKSLSSRPFLTSPRNPFPPQNSLLHKFILTSLDKNSQRPAIVDYVTKETMTHGHIGEYIGKIANRLIDWGVKPGDHVALSSYNHLNYFAVQLGIMAAGGRVALCNPVYSGREVDKLFQTADVTRVIGHERNSTDINNSVRRLGLPEPLDISRIFEESKHYSCELPEVEMGIHDTCALFYSSGTTGFPKAVEITHDNFVSQCMILDDRSAFNLSVDSVNNGFLPLFHVFGSTVGLHILQKGASTINVDGFAPVSFLETMQDYKVTMATVVPPIMVFLAKHPLVDKYDLSSLTDLMCGAAPLSQQLEDEVSERLKNDKLSFRQGYGLSETTTISHHRSKDRPKPGCVGALARNTEGKVVDIESGEECGPGEKGELYIRGPCVFKGYYKNPTATEESMTEDGFFKSGDIGYYDEDGDFFIVDRLKELIKVKGFQVAPAELEAILLEHPLIADVAVIGVPDERAGERPKAFVVRREGAVVSSDDVISYVAENAAEYKVPAEVEFIESIPKVTSGKILRKVLREQEAAKRQGN